jgi:hypothetical protein
MNAVMKTAAAFAFAMSASLSAAVAAETPAMADMSALTAKIRNFTDASHQNFTKLVLASAETRVRAKIENGGYRKPVAPFQVAANFLPDEF